MLCHVQIEALHQPQQGPSAELKKQWQIVSVTQLHIDQSITNFVLEIVTQRLLESIQTKQKMSNHKCIIATLKTVCP
jgi:hypothetical protein